MGVSYSLLGDKLLLTAGGDISDTFSVITPTLGLSYSLGLISINYALQYPLSFAGSIGQHFVGVNLEI